MESSQRTSVYLEKSLSSKILHSLHNLNSYEYAMCTTELDHSFIYTRTRMLNWVRWLPDMRIWNIFMCLAVLSAVLMSIIYDKLADQSLVLTLDTTYNLLYLVYIAGLAMNINTRDSRMAFHELVRFVADGISYIRILTRDQLAITLFYLIRINRPLEYLCTEKDFHMKGSVIGTIFKWIYLFLLVRVIMTIAKIFCDKVLKPSLQTASYLDAFNPRTYSRGLRNTSLMEILVTFHDVDKMFIPLGAEQEMIDVMDQILCMLVVMMGSLMVMGAAVASLSLVFGLYMMPKEVFRGRYRLIMKELENSNVEPSMRKTVKTFYDTYWMKQRAVSTASLLHVLPPSLYNEIITDIYFGSIQKCAMLRNLPSYFIAEVAKIMTTINYIPGDTIIPRTKPKQAMYYITYGDVEMVTAEDDTTPILRFTRGTLLTPGCGGVVVACGLSQVAIRAATFCTAYKLRTVDLWKCVLSQKVGMNVTGDILDPFFEQLARVKFHYKNRPHPNVKYLSSIYHFKMGLDKLKALKTSTGKPLLEEDIFLEIAGSYILRNNPLSEDPIFIRPKFPCILQRTSSLIATWDIFVTCCTLCITVTHPYALAFMNEVPESFLFFDQLILVIFILDAIVTLSTGEQIEEGQTISTYRTVAHQAISPRFVSDMLAILPVFNFVGKGRFAGINKLIKLPKVFNYLSTLENECMYYSYIIRFLNYTLMVVLISYLFAALNQAMMCYTFKTCDVTNLTTSPYWGTVTDDDGGRDTVAVREKRRFLFGLYWSLTFVTITSHNTVWETKFVPGTFYTMFLMELVVLMYLFVESIYSATIMATSVMQDNYEAVIRVVTDFMEKKVISSEVSKRFITYLELCWYTDHAYAITNKKQSIFHDLPPHVYKIIVAKQHMVYVKAIPFMKLLSKPELKEIASKLKLFYTSPNEILLSTGDVTSEMYVIKQGIIELFDPATKTVIRSLRAKEHFGVMECLLGIPVYYTVRAATHVQIYSLGKRFLSQIMVRRSVLDDVIQATKKSEEFQAVQANQYSPFMPYLPLKRPANRTIFKLPKKYEPDDLFQKPFQELGFLSILRYIFPRFTIRPDGKYLQRYEWFRAFCALCSAMLFPNYTYLAVQFPHLALLKYFLDFSAYFDILQRFVVGYYNEKGVLVYHPASTAVHYIKTAFLLDIMGCIPLETLEPLRKQSATQIFEYEGFRLLEIHQYLMFNRILQMYRFIMTINTLSTYLRKDFVLVLIFIALFIALCNMVTAVLVLFTVEIHYTDKFEKRLWQLSPRLLHQQPTRYYNTIWADHYASQYRFNLTKSPLNIHLATYFWVMYELTTTGYGSVMPTNADHLETLFISLLINKMLQTYFSVRVISTRSNVSKEQCTFQEHMRDLKSYMQKENLIPSLQMSTESYFMYSWDMVGSIDTRSVLKMCDQVSLRIDTILQIYGPTFNKCPFLPKRDSSLLRILSRGIRDVYFRKNTEIIRENDVTSVMYFINSGSVKIRGKVGNAYVHGTLSKGSVFGNLDSHRIRIPLKATTISNVHLLEIGSSLFHRIIADFPEVLEQMESFRKEKECYIKAYYDKRARRQRFKTIYAADVVENVEKYILARRSWLLIYFIFISLVVLLMDMYHVAFGNITLARIIILYVLDVLFMVKVFVKSIMPQHDEPSLKTRLKEFQKDYFQGEFIVDMISLIPIETLAFVYPGDHWQIFAWLRLNRLFRIPTVYYSLQYYRQKMSINLNATIVMTVAIWFSLSMHAMSCVWWYISIVEEKAMPKSSWRYDRNGTLLCSDEYVCSLFFIFMTFTHCGYGEILPRKKSEIMYVVCIQIISTMTFLIYVGEFSNTIQHNYFRVFQYYSDFLELQTYLKNNYVTVNIQQLVNRYTLHLWREYRGIQLPDLLKTAPNTIRLKVMEAVYVKYLNEHPVFSLCEYPFVRQLVGCLRVYAYVNDMYIVREEEITESMYFIHKGSIVEYSDNRPGKRYYHAGQYFGSFQGLIRRKPFMHTYKTVTMAQILILRLDDWEDILKFFPRSRRAMYGWAGEDGDNDKGADRAKSQDSRKPSDVLESSSYTTTSTEIGSTHSDLLRLRSGVQIKLSEHTRKALQDELEGEIFKPVRRGAHRYRDLRKSSSLFSARNAQSNIEISNTSLRERVPEGKHTAFLLPQEDDATKSMISILHPDRTSSKKDLLKSSAMGLSQVGSNTSWTAGRYVSPTSTSAAERAVLTRLNAANAGAPNIASFSEESVLAYDAVKNRHFIDIKHKDDDDYSSNSDSDL